MIIQIPLHAAYAYDMLAILFIKANKDYNETNNRNAENLSGCIGRQVGKELHQTIVRSGEFLELYYANLSVFERIDDIKRRAEQLGDATYIDQKNYQRFLAKKNLQEKYFPEQLMTEIKIGYNK